MMYHSDSELLRLIDCSFNDSYFRRTWSVVEFDELTSAKNIAANRIANLPLKELLDAIQMRL